jgi:hypothetical protein
MRRTAHHPRDAIGIGLASDDALQKQEKLFRQHVIELRRLINSAMLRAHNFKIASCARKNGFIAIAYDETGSRKCEIVHRMGAGVKRQNHRFSDLVPPI